MKSQKMSKLKQTFGGWRAAQFLMIALALGGWLAGSAFAQQQQANASETSKPVKAVSGASKTSSPSSSSSAESENYSSSSGSQALPAPSLLPAGVNVGNYNIQSSIELGWRYNNITGSQANYDTFVNLHQGPRLMDVSFYAHSLNHNGALFDTLSLNGFGFGGDPTSVVRLRMTKNKWYDFNATYRRYKYYWGYNLLANPLNPAVTGQPITTAPHLMDLSHRMTNLELHLLPQSSVHFRIGYTHSLEQGPSYTTTGAAVAPIAEPGATALLFQDFKTTDDMYHAGVDFDVLPRTTLSYDQFVQHYKEDTQWNDASLNYQLPNGVPVGLGLVFSTAAGTPCNPTVGSSGTTPPTADPSCDGNLYYDRGGRPRGTTPTERFSFQTTYFRNLNMTGALSYSSGDQVVNDLYDTWAGYDARINAAGADTTATSKANRIIVNGNWAAIYQITSKLRASETFNYNDYQIPGIYNFGVVNFYAQEAPGGGASMELPPGQFTPTDCPAPYTAATCPQHNSSSGPDLAQGYRSRYLGQKWLSDTIQLAYDFNPKVGARIGYRYTHRKIYDQDTLYYTAEVFYPGGPNGAAAAYRGDCALQNGQLPPGCTLQPDGSVIFSGLTPGTDTSHGLVADISGNSALFGMWVRPVSNFRTSVDVELFSADEAFTRVTPRQLRHYTVNSVYTPVHWVEITGDIDIVNGSDNVVEVFNKDHNRSYGLTTIFTPDQRFSFDLSYDYNDVYTQALDCYTVGFGPTPAGASTCPVYPDLSEVNVAAMSTYQSKTNFASADMMIKPSKQVTFTLGYEGSFVRGTPSWYNPLGTYSVNFLDPQTPWGPLRYNYQAPYMKLNWNVYKGLSYIAAWNYYGYNSRGDNNPVGLAPLGTQDFNGNNMTLSAKYTF